MITLAVNIMSEVRSRFVVLPMSLHLAFCAFTTAVFLILFFRGKKLSNLIWAIACDTTLILQFYNDKYTAGAVFICEVVLFAILAWLWFRDKKAAKLISATEEADDGGDTPKDDDLEDIAKLVKTERDRLDNDGSVIDNAFEDDKL